MSDKEIVDDLAGSVSLIIKALLVSGRQGAPAEGRIPFNPLYFHLMRALDRDGPTRPSDIADALAVPRTTISTAVKALQKRDLLATAPDETDGRAITVDLTSEGKDVVSAILRQDHKNALAMLSALQNDERETFVRLLGKIAQTINHVQQTP